LPARITRPARNRRSLLVRATGLTLAGAIMLPATATAGAMSRYPWGRKALAKAVAPTRGPDAHQHISSCWYREAFGFCQPLLAADSLLQLIILKLSCEF
jgi:hypothetical protein